MVKRPFSLLVPSYYSLTIETVINSDRVLVYAPPPPVYDSVQHKLSSL